MVDCKGATTWCDLPDTKDDATIAMHSANGFGIEEKDIVYIEDWTAEQIDKIANEIKLEFRAQSGRGKRTFLYIYCCGHGMVDGRKR